MDIFMKVLTSMAALLLWLMMMMMMMITLTSSHPQDVTSYGAVGDGKTDDSHAFLKAWNATCRGRDTDSFSQVLLVPAGNTFLLKSLEFKGPCNSDSITVQIDGNIIAPCKISDWSKSEVHRGWISFHHVNALTLTGNGTIDGQGSEWWQLCHTLGKKKCKKLKRPTALKFVHCNELRVSGLKHHNSQRNHISITKSNGVTLSSLHINAPQTSPNTDGVDISSSVNVTIQHSNIATGDDCIAINNKCSNIHITGIACGPGHGISVGSLGYQGQRVAVNEIHVSHCTFNGTKNGARIKTWQGGCGSARNISFDHITLIAVDRPIIIDQQYYDLSMSSSSSSSLWKSAVKISNVSFTNFQGTSRRKDAIELKCSGSEACNNIIMDHINITSVDPQDKTYASCVNANAISYDTIPRVDCSDSLY